MATEKSKSQMKEAMQRITDVWMVCVGQSNLLSFYWLQMKMLVCVLSGVFWRVKPFFFSIFFSSWGKKYKIIMEKGWFGVGEGRMSKWMEERLLWISPSTHFNVFDSLLFFYRILRGFLIAWSLNHCVSFFFSFSFTKLSEK